MEIQCTTQANWMFISQDQAIHFFWLIAVYFSILLTWYIKCHLPMQLTANPDIDRSWICWWRASQIKSLFLLMRVPAGSLVTYSCSGWSLHARQCIEGSTRWGSALNAAISASPVSHHCKFLMNPQLMMQQEQQPYYDAPQTIWISSLVCQDDFCIVWGGLHRLQSRTIPWNIMWDAELWLIILEIKVLVLRLL